jgi:hypothetical protein
VRGTVTALAPAPGGARAQPPLLVFKSLRLPNSSFFFSFRFSYIELLIDRASPSQLSVPVLLLIEFITGTICTKKED